MAAEMGRASRRKYQPELLLASLRIAVAARNKMKELGLTDNGGAIHSAERVLNILGLCLNHPDLSHINNLKQSPKAQFSIEAWELHRKGHKVFIEHVSPVRHLTQTVIGKIDSGASDAQ